MGKVAQLTPDVFITLLLFITPHSSPRGQHKCGCQCVKCVKCKHNRVTHRRITTRAGFKLKRKCFLIKTT